MEPPIVELHNASAVLSGRRVLHDLCWALRRSEHWAVFGNNGAGKTTFLRLVAGQQWPTPGAPYPRRYDFGAGPEYDAVTARQRLRFVGPELHDRYVSQRLNPTVMTVIATGMQDSRILRMTLETSQRKTIARLAERLAIMDLIDRSFLHLSRGQQRKVLIARAMISVPQVLLLDEVCDGLDGHARTDLLNFLDSACASGLQIMFATHRRTELPRAVKHFLELDEGRIVATGLLNAESPSLSEPSNRSSALSHRERPVDEQVRSNVLIVIRNGTLYRGMTPVITHLNWRLEPGQHWRVSGANGSGKSSFLKLLYGDLRPARGGEITWFGAPALVNIWAVRQQIGMVSDELQSIYGDDISVTDCVATGFNASVGRIPVLTAVQRQTVLTALAETNTDVLRDISVRRLSYGEFRRVLLARALVQRPRVLLLDEPTSGVDSESCALIWRRVLDLVEQGTQLVLASHEDDIGNGVFTHELALANGRAHAIA